MKVSDAGLPGVKVIEPGVVQDARGFFMESYNREALLRHGIAAAFVQDNHSLSAVPGTLRGLHYQLEPRAQTKLVRVTAGRVFDVVVDIRRGSPAFGRWEGFELSADNKKQLLVPQGFAHGFVTLEPDTEVLYKVDAYYSQPHDRGIAWDDPELGIAWPLAPAVLSAKDGRHPPLREADINFTYSR
ncbi:dTDP-4-dehydrorhamnose 3,5-epimerase [Paenibacillus sp. UNC496MF]|uniref:dTDP-4-dehydrorhamnose 3,5-epimerase n=1 Tax=Paenibacillus sp. UNC496MF TaxID=1502753 RepID=UPI0008E2F8D0|nr:dTDP-4-dehydrorhamnose 3,5-epimerase [Paenibacillus sp. UNC496MF]SFI72279.1 dTDP-4-dehydrorhamnose 3,5-epimerase [Paenibacillus sp. UNC496MF]